MRRRSWREASAHETWVDLNKASSFERSLARQLMAVTTTLLKSGASSEIGGAVLEILVDGIR